MIPEQFIQYLAEVRPGETVAVYTRMLGLTDKRIHLMHFMANQDTDGFRSRLVKDQHLGWDSPVSGVM